MMKAVRIYKSEDGRWITSSRWCGTQISASDTFNRAVTEAYRHYLRARYRWWNGI